MKNSVTFEEQTEKIVEALLSGFIGKKTAFRGLRFEGSEVVSLEGFMEVGRKGVIGGDRTVVHAKSNVLLSACIPGPISTQGASGSATTFDPVAIASYLRNIADKYNEDLEPSAGSIIAEIGKKKVEQFGKTVESLSKTWSNQYGMQYEKAFLIISVKLFVYLAQKAQNIAQPNLLTTAINGNPQVRDYIEHQGGWENLGN